MARMCFLQPKKYFCNVVSRWDTRQRNCLKHYATFRKVAGLIPDEVIGFFNWPNPSSRNMTPDVNSASNRNEYQENSWG
jgi:hypothetical protein